MYNNSTLNRVNKEPPLFPFIIIIIIAVIAIITNLFLIIIISTRQKIRKRRSNKFLLNLLVSDFIVAVTSLCFSALVLAVKMEDHGYDDGEKPPIVLALMINIFIMLIILNVIILSIDRLLAVIWTFHYLASVKSIHVNIVLFGPWMFGIIYFLTLLTVCRITEVREIASELLFISFDILIIFGFLILVVSNSFIFKEARTQLIAISRTNVSTMDEPKEKEKKLKQRECRLALINIGIVVKFMMLWFPMIITMIYHQIYDEILSKLLVFTAYGLVLFNCICDPVMYVYLSKDIKKAVLRLFGTNEIQDSSIGSNDTII